MVFIGDTMRCGQIAKDVDAVTNSVKVTISGSSCLR